MASPEAPTGTVTLVFTDVQGSTVLWEEATDAMRTSLDLHNGVARTHLASCGGYEVKTEGDAFMVAFDSPLNAVSWCLRVQTALLTVPWPAELLSTEHGAQVLSADTVLWRGLKVRMGVHLGRPDCRPSPVTGRMDYFGPMVNRAARVAGAASGGQILVSGDVWDALGEHQDDLGRPASRALGEYWLKGLKTPERLVEILPASLSARRFGPPGGAPATQAAPSDNWFKADEAEHIITMLQLDQPSLDASGVMHPARERNVSPSDLGPATPLELEQRPARKRKTVPDLPAFTAPVFPRRRKKLPWLIALALVAGLVVAIGPMRHQLPPPFLGWAEAVWWHVQPSRRLLSIGSTPPGAQVRAGDRELGRTPLVIENDFAAGTVKVVLTLPGYEPSILLAEGGESGALHATLTPQRGPPSKKKR